jgi:hypothetical protein
MESNATRRFSDEAAAALPDGWLTARGLETAKVMLR